MNYDNFYFGHYANYIIEIMKLNHSNSLEFLHTFYDFEPLCTVDNLFDCMKYVIITI